MSWEGNVSLAFDFALVYVSLMQLYVEKENRNALDAN